MNTCAICRGPINWSSTVGEYDLREWHLGKATAEKGFTCEACLVSLMMHIDWLRQGRPA
jgi:hypothetical protein